MKKLCILLAALFLLGCLSACGSAAPAETPAAETEAEPQAEPASETESAAEEEPVLDEDELPILPEGQQPEEESDSDGDGDEDEDELPILPEGQQPEEEPADDSVYLEDFTLQTCDGGTFTLSRELEDHELVLINLFATWCGPCAWEFPYLQEAWSANSDKVSVIAVSLEPDDSDKVLRQYEKDMGLSFPMANVKGTDLGRFSPGYIPVTILVDRDSRVVATEGGAQSSTQAFQELFDTYTSPKYIPGMCYYSLEFFDVNYTPMEGIIVNFCTDTACTPVTTDAEGMAYFSGPQARYHVQVIQIPEGYEFVDPGDFYTEPYSQNYSIMLRKVG